MDKRHVLSYKYKEGWPLKTSSSNTRNGIVIRTSLRTSRNCRGPTTVQPSNSISPKEHSLPACSNKSPTPSSTKLRVTSSQARWRLSIRRSQRPWRKGARWARSPPWMWSSVAELTFARNRSRRCHSIWASGRRAWCWREAMCFLCNLVHNLNYCFLLDESDSTDNIPPRSKPF